MKFQKKIISPCHDFVETSPFRQGGLMATSPYNRRQTTGSRRKILRRVAPQYDKAGDRPQTADNRFTAKDDSFFKSRKIYVILSEAKNLSDYGWQKKDTSSLRSSV